MKNKKKLRRTIIILSAIALLGLLVVVATTVPCVKLELVPPVPELFDRIEIRLTIWQSLKFSYELRSNPRNLNPAWYVWKGTIKIAGPLFGETEVDVYDPYGEYKVNGKYRTGPTPTLKWIIDSNAPFFYKN